jgi:flavin-binding protein dodecin
MGIVLLGFGSLEYHRACLFVALEGVEKLFGLARRKTSVSQRGWLCLCVVEPRITITRPAIAAFAWVISLTAAIASASVGLALTAIAGASVAATTVASTASVACATVTSAAIAASIISTAVARAPITLTAIGFARVSASISVASVILPAVVTAIGSASITARVALWFEIFEQHLHVVAGGCICGVGLERPPKFGDGFLPVALRRQHGAAVVVNLGLQCPGSVETFSALKCVVRFLLPPSLEEGIGQVVLNDCI